ncbi:hypothetical protein [Chryseobacterium rhizosphaerae]|jgi:hypothetical protein|uniref:Uncharacterized protein n=1 Tax=Chryseobacterium rhizosphaerae TaxID=395937 RepID=A0ABX9IFF5_9FLAO|nr:hypothetical protein [Chryseobacterium rhizosphaerae]MDC8101795.1 hypothetical protein [Chryseobacterium rhizosphaerae]MDR6547698.1 hypothetical protein [Chryseobacterium rhizosphaerae]REC71815.1 hypothetical protein DRF57_20135 [Chryseobacterium rhizosphaerae]GEN69172.1 hypothetical protein CRH01_37400 [Chryseobacterium rhizosphaerae]
MKLLYIIALSCAALIVKGQSGNVGIGTTSPTATLHVKTSNPYILRIEDNVNTSSSNYTIQSSDNKGTFEKVATNKFRKVQIFPLTTGTSINTLYPLWQSTSIIITLQPGRWIVTGVVLLKASTSLSGSNKALIGRATFSDVIGGVNPSLDIEGANSGTSGQAYFKGALVAPLPYDLMLGNIIINNNTSTNKSYYMIANIEKIGGLENFINFGASTEKQNQIYAIPIN